MQWLKKLAATLGDLFHSKKFLVAAGATAAAIQQGMPPGKALIVGAGSYVLGQGLADFGKNAGQQPSAGTDQPPAGTKP